MRLSTKGRYAVMAMVDLANYGSETGKPISLADVAERQEISLSYLEQLFGKLRRKGGEPRQVLHAFSVQGKHVVLAPVQVLD